MLVGLVLEQVQRSNDISAAMKVLYLSKTFYIKGKEGKKFVLQGIQLHPLWQDLNFWEKAIFYKIRDEIQQRGT